MLEPAHVKNKSALGEPGLDSEMPKPPLRSLSLIQKASATPWEAITSRPKARDGLRYPCPAYSFVNKEFLIENESSKCRVLCLQNNDLFIQVVPFIKFVRKNVIFADYFLDVFVRIYFRQERSQKRTKATSSRRRRCGQRSEWMQWRCEATCTVAETRRILQKTKTRAVWSLFWWDCLILRLAK